MRWEGGGGNNADGWGNETVVADFYGFKMKRSLSLSLGHARVLRRMNYCKET